MTPAARRQFKAADRAIERACERIERAIAALLDTTLPLESVATDRVLEWLIAELIERNPKALDYLNNKRGEATMRIAVALEDWRDLWEQR